MPKDPVGEAPQQMSLPSGTHPFPNKKTVRTRSSADAEAFEDDCEFQDDVHGSIHLNPLERDVVDSPEFRRLFHLRQLGFVDFVYPTANHTRGTHSIGACHLAKKLVTKLNENSEQPISRSERVLISLGALLHDIPHGPLSHDIEKKTHRIYPFSRSKPVKVQSHYGLYEKHDNFTANPALYFFLMDSGSSVLARVLRQYSPTYVNVLKTDAKKHSLLGPFVDAIEKSWPNHREELLPALLFHLLIYEKPDEAEAHSISLRTSFEKNEYADWGLGPHEARELLHRTWYQPFRHDIIGDTLSADLLDYLLRDQARLGIHNELDLKLLNHYVLVRTKPRPGSIFEKGFQLRCAIDLNDHKRGTFRAERLNDIFRLLDLRHQIHEKAVHHRVVQSAVAMLSRTGLILGDRIPNLSELYGFDSGTPALAGDDRFLERLVSASETSTDTTPSARTSRGHRGLPQKISERRVYRPLMVIPGDRIQYLLKDICDFQTGLEDPLRELAALVDSTFFASFILLVSNFIEKLLQHAIDSEEEIDTQLTELAGDDEHLTRARAAIPQRVIFWTTPYKQLYKDPAILVQVNELEPMTIDDLLEEESVSTSLKQRLEAGIRDAETKNEALWKMYVFVSDGLFYTGLLARLRPSHPCAADPSRHEKHLQEAQRVVVRAVRCAWRYWQSRGKKIDLSAKMSNQEFAELLKLFVADGGWFKLGYEDLPNQVSAVKISQYLHGDASIRCRDVRYKFDSRRSFSEVLSELVPGGEKQELVRQGMRAMGVDPEQFGGEELSEIISRLHGAGAKVKELVSDKAARSSPTNESKLKELWLDDLQ